MKTLVFDTDHRGHHLQFVGLLSNALANRGHQVVAVVGSKARESEEGRAHLSNLHDGVSLDQTHSFPTLASPIKNTRERLAQLTASVTQHKPDRIYLPYGAGLVELMAFGAGRKLLANTPTEILVLRGYKSKSRKDRLKNFLRKRLYRFAAFDRIHFLAPFEYELATRSSEKCPHFTVMPEPVENFYNITTTDAKQLFGIGPKSRVVSCLGGISQQKNVPNLIDAFLSANVQPDDKLLLVGKQDDSVSQKIDSIGCADKERLVVVNQYVDNQTFLNAIVASDVVTVPYRARAASSGIYVRAIRAKKTVVVDKGEYLAWLTEKFEFGRTCDVLDLQSFSNAISKALETDHVASDSTAKDTFRSFHTIDNFCQTWLDGVEANSSNEPVSISWNSVVKELNG